MARLILALLLLGSLVALAPITVYAQTTTTREAPRYCSDVDNLNNYSRSAIEWGVTQNGYAHTEPRARDLLRRPHSVAMRVIANSHYMRLADYPVDISDMVYQTVYLLMQEDAGIDNVGVNSFGLQGYQDELRYCSIPVR
jgi:hypothetical protein